MTLPTPEALTELMELTAVGYAWNPDNGEDRVSHDARVAGVIAVRDAILDVLIAEAEQEHAKDNTDDSFISPWQDGVENIPLYHVTSDREYSESVGDLVATWLRAMKDGTS